MEIIKIVILSLSGLLLLFVGAMRLSNPIKTYSKNSGIQLAKDVNLLNEIRGVSSVMLCAGIIVLTGIFVQETRLTSFIVASLMFLGFALGRLIGIGVDGKPNKLLIQGLWFEIILGGANLFGILKTLA